MRLLRFLLSLSLYTLFMPLLAEAKEAPSKTKLQRITGLAAKAKGLIVLDDRSYEDLTSTPRNYTTLVLLTALDPALGCHLCREFHPELELLAKSWFNSHRDIDGLFFSYLDFQSGRGTFKKLGLTTAPVLYLFPPTYGPHAMPGNGNTPISYEFSHDLYQAEVVAAWITRNTQYTVTVKRPINYARYIILATSVVLALTTVKVAFPYVMPIVQHPALWAGISLILILLFTSGHMFNHIRKTPYVVQSPKGGITYIAAGYSNQFGMESQIIGVVYAFLAFSTISLAMKVPRMSDSNHQRAAVIIWSMLILCFFSFLKNIFNVKHPSYPFKLPPLM